MYTNPMLWISHPALLPHLYDVKLAGMVFPFKASPYYVDELIDWNSEDVRKDPFYTAWSSLLSTCSVRDIETN
jgi:hypothetical protein